MKIFSTAVALIALTSYTANAEYLRNGNSAAAIDESLETTHRQAAEGGTANNGNMKKDGDNMDDPETSNGTADFRFNKFSVPADVNLDKPLGPADYPIMGELYETLKLTDAISVINQEDYEVKMDIATLINAVGGLPSQPEADSTAPFWEKLREVMDVQDARRNDPNTPIFTLPDIWEGSDLNQVADYVHNEYPGIIQSALLADILTNRYGPVVLDFDVVPYRSNSMFLRRDIMVADMSSWAMSTVGPYNFAAKWYAGRARPEEVVWAIKTGQMTEGVPEDIAERIANLDISDQREFTAYSEGSPRHPSWPAMHSAIASVSFWLSVVLDINNEQLCQARLTDYAISYARTVAGVHYTDDNLTGMNLAQEVLAASMPTYLSEKFGADATLIEKKIRKNRFDWNTFDPADPCPFLRRN